MNFLLHPEADAEFAEAEFLHTFRDEFRLRRFFGDFDFFEALARRFPGFARRELMGHGRRCGQGQRREPGEDA